MYVHLHSAVLYPITEGCHSIPSGLLSVSSDLELDCIRLIPSPQTVYSSCGLPSERLIVSMDGRDVDGRHPPFHCVYLLGVAFAALERSATCHSTTQVITPLALVLVPFSAPLASSNLIPDIMSQPNGNDHRNGDHDAFDDEDDLQFELDAGFADIERK